MPWRKKPTPYFVWLSEIMLQQTQVDTVIPYFERFVKKFPTVGDLAGSDLQSVLKCWEGLGYYSRARNLHKAAKIVAKEYAGEFPNTYEGLQKLPGVGPYCGAAIASIAFGQAVSVVDGNVLRVFTRFWGLFDDIRAAKIRRILFEKLNGVIADQKPAEFNQAMMELGALICKPKNPKCGECPLSGECFAFRFGKIAELPVKSPAKKTPHYDIGVGVIWKGDKILIGKRREEKMLGGLWEFPGGKKKPGENLEETVKRECKEETGLDVRVLEKYGAVKHAYSHFKITMTAFRCEIENGKPEALSAEELRWIALDECEHYPFPQANKKLLEKIRSV